jgi:lipoprotein-releasing system permease protein
VFDDAFTAPTSSPRLAAMLGAGWQARDWTLENASYFRAIRIEKTMMTLILLLVVAVAAFNIVAMLVMVVRAKRTDIAILRTLGLPARSIVWVFIAQGVVIGWLGTGLGVLGGVLLGRHVETVAAWLESVLRFHILDADVYYVTRIPSVVDARDVLGIGMLAVVLTLLATVYPAQRAAATEPAEALRYE